MRKVTRIIMAVSMIVTLFFTVVSNVSICAAETASKEQTSTETNTDFEVNVGSTEGKSGDLVTVPINFKNVPAERISTCELKINYDPTKLEYVTSKGGSIIPDALCDFGGDKTADGNIQLLLLSYLMESGHDITTDGVFAEITFKVIDSTIGSTPIEIKDSTFGDKSLNHLYPIVNSGKVTIVNTSIFTDFEVNVGSTEGKFGDLVTVPISFKNVPAEMISTCLLKITYDPTKLEYVSSKGGSIIPRANLDFAGSEKADGNIDLLFVYYQPVSGRDITMDGVFAELTFKVIASNIGSTPIEIKESTFGDKSLNHLYPKINSGLVTRIPAQNVYKLSDYIEPDFLLSTATGPKARQGFKVELVGTDFYALTDANGYFEIKDVPVRTYDLKISKRYHLTRQITNISVNTDKGLSAKSTPISLWIGDVNENGAINMEDIMTICKSFNSNTGDDNYKECHDINFDGAINLEDIMIVAKHFNKISSDYK